MHILPSIAYASNGSVAFESVAFTASEAVAFDAVACDLCVLPPPQKNWKMWLSTPHMHQLKQNHPSLNLLLDATALRRTTHSFAFLKAILLLRLLVWYLFVFPKWYSITATQYLFWLAKNCAISAVWNAFSYVFPTILSAFFAHVINKIWYYFSHKTIPM